jgi:hypothetical protein
MYPYKLIFQAKLGSWSQNKMKFITNQLTSFSVVIKKLGEENIKFDISSNELDNLYPITQL